MKGNSRMKLTIFAILSALFLLACGSESTTESTLTVSQQLQQAMDRGLRNYNGKGISAAIIYPSGEIWQGVAGISHGTVTITKNTLFSAGSITKTFTAATILQMAAEGKISLADSLYQWLPPFPNIDSTITLRHLLNHTSGIFNLTGHPGIWTNIFADPTRIWTLEEAVTNYTLTPDFEKGTGWNYSNTGYLLLRMIIKQISESDIGTVYRSRFYSQHDLTQSYTAIDESLPLPMAHGWMDLNGDNVLEDLGDVPMNSFYSMAGGGVFCTPLDLAKWARALFIEKSVVPPPFYNQMITFHMPTPGEDLLDGYGLGICRFEPTLVNGLEVWGHGGDAIGYAAACFYLVDYDVCLGFMDNTQNGDAMWVIMDLLNIIVEEMEN